MAIGFDTPSKRQAEEMENNSPQAEGMPSSQLQAETYERVNALGDMIMSPQFSALPMEQKQMILIDFAYFKNIAGII